MRKVSRTIVGGRGWTEPIVRAISVLSVAGLCVTGLADKPRQDETRTITVPAASADGYVLKGPIKAGTELTLQYVSGKWAAWPGDMEQISPDNPSRISCRTVFAERSKPGGPISILDLVPGGTSTLPKEYRLDHDAGEIIFRMNGKNGELSKNTGSVQYKLTIRPAD